MRVLLIRHGQTSKNTVGAVHSQNDSEPLNETGLAQAHKVAEICKRKGVTLVLHSPESRSTDTAKIIAAQTGAELHAVPELRERNWGDWSSLPWLDIKARLDQMSFEERFTFVPPQGESWQQMVERLQVALDALTHLSAEVVAVVAHAGCLRALLPIIDHEPHESSYQYDLQNASITEYEFDRNSNAQRLSLDDTSHLESA
jgi:broad specificity phosphatase PhoE